MRLTGGLGVAVLFIVLVPAAMAQPPGGRGGRGRGPLGPPPRGGVQAFGQIRGDGPRDPDALRPPAERQAGEGDDYARARPERPLVRNLEPLFAWFDGNGDNVLDRQEFGELSQFVQRRMMRPERPLPGPPGAGPAVAPADRAPDSEPGPAARRGRGRRGAGFEPGEPGRGGRGIRRGRGLRGAGEGAPDGPRPDRPVGEAPTDRPDRARDDADRDERRDRDSAARDAAGDRTEENDVAGASPGASAARGATIGGIEAMPVENANDAQ